MAEEGRKGKRERDRGIGREGKGGRKGGGKKKKRNSGGKEGEREKER